MLLNKLRRKHENKRIEDDPEGGYNAKALGYNIFTEGETIDEIKENIKNAIKCHFDNKDELPDIIRLHIVKEEMFSYV